MVVAALTTGHKIGLAVVAVVFIAFALTSSLLVPRRRPDFPGRAGLSVFVIASIGLFAAMIAAIAVFGAEGEAAKASESSAAAKPRAVFQVQEKEFKIVLPPAARKPLKPGTYRFVTHDVGKVQHDLAIKGPKVSEKTSLVSPGGSAALTVTLGTGRYTLWCTVPGHRQLGMVATIRVS